MSAWQLMAGLLCILPHGELLQGVEIVYDEGRVVRP